MGYPLEYHVNERSYKSINMFTFACKRSIQEFRHQELEQRSPHIKQ